VTLPLTVAELVVDVVGQPVQQGSMIAVTRGGKTVLVPDNSSPLKAWRKNVTGAVRARMALTGWAPVDCAVAVTIDFWLPRPAAAAKRRHPHVRPDIDKLARACLDSLTGTAITDDARVVRLVAAKHYAEATCGARIRIEAL
jgi:crossover junction endodeoxyribonuclease RusA